MSRQIRARALKNVWFLLTNFKKANCQSKLVSDQLRLGSPKRNLQLLEFSQQEMNLPCSQRALILTLRPKEKKDDFVAVIVFKDHI